MQAITDERGASLSIGALSQQTGVHIETIRYYERVKMLAAPPRTEGGRRLYSQSHRRTLGFIRRARDLGFSLDEIRALLDLDGSGRASCAEVREIASHHLVNVRAKLADLARLETVLSETVGQCAATLRQHALCSAFSIPRTCLSKRKDCEVSKKAASKLLLRETGRPGVLKRLNFETGFRLPSAAVSRDALHGKPAVAIELRNRQV